ncbi:MAG: hypothetical protein C0507_09675 [Cyanobacteria bacterium PR.3.49]|nr:hypothetical protein [Cyanobacteria bacterium PR.3.49]
MRFTQTPEVHAIRENVHQALTGSELRESIQNLYAEGGHAAFTQAQVTRVDTSAQHLPAMEISGTDAAVIKDKKLAAAQKDDLRVVKPEGGVSGLIDRTDSDNDDKLTREEIQTRLKAKDITKSDAAALTVLLNNYDEIDKNNNGKINRYEIFERERKANDAQSDRDRLAELRQFFADYRKALDTNNDGTVSSSEINSAKSANDRFNERQRDLLQWADEHD